MTEFYGISLHVPLSDGREIRIGPPDVERYGQQSKNIVQINFGREQAIVSAHVFRVIADRFDPLERRFGDDHG